MSFNMADIQIAMVAASQRAQNKVSDMIQQSTEVVGVSSITSTAMMTVGGGPASVKLVTQFKFDLTNPTNSALFNAAVNNLQLLNNYATATMQSLKTMISTNISNLR